MSSSWDRILKISLQQFYKTLSFFYVFWYGLTFITLLYIVFAWLWYCQWYSTSVRYKSKNTNWIENIISLKMKYLFNIVHLMQWRNWIKMKFIKSKCKSLMRNKFCATFNLPLQSIMPNVFSSIESWFGQEWRERRKRNIWNTFST